MRDPIIKELRQTRDAHTKQFNCDIHVICDDLRNRTKTIRCADSLAAFEAHGKEERASQMHLTPST